MKRLCLGLMLLSPFAQADVTISGEIDAYMDYIAGDAEDGVGSDSDTLTMTMEPTIYFQGSAKLDSGLEGIWAYNLTSADTDIQNHSYWAGFKGDFGTFRAGKMNTPGWEQIDWYLTHWGSLLGEQMYTYNDTVIDYNRSSSGGPGRRQNNQMRLDTTLGPLALSGSVILNERQDDHPWSMGYSLAAQWGLGATTLYASYEHNTDRVTQDATLGRTIGGYEFATAGVGYKSGPWDLGAAYLYTGVESTGALNYWGTVYQTSNAKTKQNTWWIRAGYTTGPWTFSGLYGQAGDFDRSGDAGSDLIPYFGAGEYDHYGVAVRYAASKSYFIRFRLLAVDGKGDGNTMGNQLRGRANLYYLF